MSELKMIDRLEHSISLLEMKIEESQSKLEEVNTDISNKALDRFAYYREIIAKQRNYLATLIHNNSSLNDTLRLINLINSLSIMIKEDAENLIYSLTISGSRDDKDSLN